MDEHTIVRILLEYYTNNFKLWQVARLINKEITSIVNAKPYDKACYGRSTFIRTEWCSICQKNNPKAPNRNRYSGLSLLRCLIYRNTAYYVTFSVSQSLANSLNLYWIYG